MRYDQRYERPTEVDALIGDASKVEAVLGWKAQTHAHALARLMVDADIAALGGVPSDSGAPVRSGA